MFCSEKTEFLCSSASLMIWWLSPKPGHSSAIAAKPRRLPKAESPCSSDSALIFALSDVSESRRLPALGRPLDLHVGVLGFTGPVPFTTHYKRCLQTGALSLDLALLSTVFTRIPLCLPQGGCQQQQHVVKVRSSLAVWPIRGLLFIWPSWLRPSS